MALYRRDDSPFWWMVLTARGRRAKRESTQIPVDAPSAEQRKALKQSAAAIFAKRQAEWVLGAAGVSRPSITLAAYLVWYAQHVTAHHKGKIRERSMLKQLRADLGPILLSELTRERLLEWRTARALQVAPASVNRELDVLKAALTQAVPKYLDASPARGIPRLHHQAPPRGILSPEDEARLLGVLEAPDQAIVIAALDTLMRAGDLLRLTWADDHGGYLSIVDPKTGRPYEVPVSTRLRAALDALPRAGRYLFGHRRPANGRSIELWRFLREACTRAGIAFGRHGGLTFHGLRHTGASRLVAAGVDLRTVQAIGGWSSMRQLTRYTHPTAAHLVAAVNTIGAAVPFTPPSRTVPPPADSLSESARE